MGTINDHNNHLVVLDNDLRESKDVVRQILICLKLFYYLLQRPIANFFLKKSLKKHLINDSVFNQVDRFLLNEGGMFKRYVYSICNKYVKIKNSAILVPGAGYGRNLFQLAAFKPRFILAFDLYEYKEEWEYLSRELESRGIEAVFTKGDFNDLPKEYQNFFDLIITDAVLEHVRNLPEFLENSKKFLRNGGLFYASLGPIWYGPGGDHIDWGENNLFDHLLLDKENYEKSMKGKIKLGQIDSCEGFFMFKEKLFSYLFATDYFKIFSEAGFKKELVFAKISTRAVNFLKKRLDMVKLLDEKGIPLFDRYCSGLYLWMKK